MPILLLSIVLLLVGLAISYQLKRKLAEYGKILIPSGYSGKEVAEKMLSDNGIHDVKIEIGQGMLTDHYNPQTKTVSLSPDVYNGRNVAAAAVAAHECGHAVQHQQAYAWLQMRSTLVPVVQYSGSVIQWILLAGILLINTFPAIMLAGIILFGIITLFSLITLPVEFDASKRALVWIDKSQIMSTVDHAKAKDALNWAALTYVVAAVSSIATLLWYIMIYSNRRS